jgi:hypothetical protein
LRALRAEDHPVPDSNKLDPNNLEALVAQLAPKVAALLRLQHGALYTIPEFCTRNKISRSTYFAEKRAETGPKTIAVGKTGAQKRVSPAAEQEWRARKEKQSQSKAARLANERRRVGAKKAAAQSVLSPDHPHPRGSGKANKKRS